MTASRILDRYVRRGSTGYVWRTTAAVGTAAAQFEPGAGVTDITENVASVSGLRPVHRFGTVARLGSPFEAGYVAGVSHGPVRILLYDETGGDAIRTALTGTGWLYVFTDADAAAPTYVGARFDVWPLRTLGPVDQFADEGPALYVAEFAVVAAPTLGMLGVVT